jgi:uncharacterized protein YjbI with pentapeptide repeats
MMRSLKLASVTALFLLAMSLSAFADSNNDFSGATLSGISATGASGSFAFSSSTDKFSNAAQSFGRNSISEGVKVTNRLMSGYFISERSFSGGSFSGGSFSGGSFSGGTFSGDSDEGLFGEDRLSGKHRKKWNVPEGGAEVTYLLLSGIAMLAGILISGKQRRATHAARSF